MDFAVPADHREKNKHLRKAGQVLGPCQRTKEAMELEGGSDTSCNWCTRNDRQRFGKEARRVRNRRTSRDHSNSNITKIDQNTEKALHPRDVIDRLHVSRKGGREFFNIQDSVDTSTT